MAACQQFQTKFCPQALSRSPTHHQNYILMLKSAFAGWQSDAGSDDSHLLHEPQLQNKSIDVTHVGGDNETGSITNPCYSLFRIWLIDRFAIETINLSHIYRHNPVDVLAS